MELLRWLNDQLRMQWLSCAVAWLPDSLGLDPVACCGDTVVSTGRVLAPKSIEDLILAHTSN